jgi:hypothetical protein
MLLDRLFSPEPEGRKLVLRGPHYFHLPSR